MHSAVECGDDRVGHRIGRIEREQSARAPHLGLLETGSKDC